METEKREMTTKEKNILTIIIALLVLIAFITISLVENYMRAKREQEESMKTVLVTDNSRYFTVLGCAKKFLNHSQTGSTEDLLSLLKDEYKESFRITASNVRNFVPKLDAGSTYDYEGGAMYQHRISKNVVEYYIDGKIKKGNFDEDATFVDYDLTIILYEDKLLFAVKPGIGDLEL